MRENRLQVFPLPPHALQLARTWGQIVFGVRIERGVKISNGAGTPGIKLLTARNFAEPVSQPLLGLRMGQSAILALAFGASLSGGGVVDGHIILDVPAPVSLWFLKQATCSPPSLRLLGAEFFRHGQPPSWQRARWRWPLPPFAHGCGAGGVSLPPPLPARPGSQAGGVAGLIRPVRFWSLFS